MNDHVLSAIIGIIGTLLGVWLGGRINQRSQIIARRNEWRKEYREKTLLPLRDFLRDLLFPLFAAFYAEDPKEIKKRLRDFLRERERLMLQQDFLAPAIVSDSVLQKYLRELFEVTRELEDALLTMDFDNMDFDNMSYSQFEQLMDKHLVGDQLEKLGVLLRDINSRIEDLIVEGT